MGSWKAPTVKFSETVLISPESPTPPEKQRLLLSNLDRIEMCIFTPVILLYAAPVGGDFETVVASLKDSLRKALVEYYPFAGRLTRGKNGLEEVRCDDAGAFFTVAVVEEELEEIGGFEGCVMLSGMEAAKLSSTGIHSLNDFQEIPALVIQVTCFKCRSIALAVNWHHQVCDGNSGMMFLKAWSELTRGLPVTAHPDHRRHLLSARVPPQPVESCPMGFKSLSANPQKEKAVQASEGEEAKACKKVEFTLSEEEIKQLKKEGSGAFTSGECISAHLWRLVTKARGLNREESTSIYSVVDARKKMKDLPMIYFGNCVFFTRADCNVGELLDMSLAQISELIHDSIVGVTDEYVKSVVDYIEVTGASNMARHRPGTFTTHDVQPTFWRFFPIYELDFGFGRPEYGGRNSPLDGSTGFAVVSPTPKDGSVVISVFVYAETADELSAVLEL